MTPASKSEAREGMKIIRSFTIVGADGTPYMTRYTLATLFGMSLRVHRFYRPDGDACPHDHPWWFASLILRGGYVERIRVADGVEREQVNRPGRLLWRPAGFAHTVTRLLAPEVWTLVLTGPKGRAWGFFTRNGWIGWRRFVDAAPDTRVAWCEESPLSTGGSR